MPKGSPLQRKLRNGCRVRRKSFNNCTVIIVNSNVARVDVYTNFPGRFNKRQVDVTSQEEVESI